MLCVSCGYAGIYNNNPDMKTCYNCGFPFPPPMKPITQKAKGLVVLAKMQQGTWYPWYNSGAQTLRIKALLKVAEALPATIATFLPSFCRPCPPSPEHGFVESRVIWTVDQLEALRIETAAACAESEIMLTPVFSSVTWNSVWTPTLLTIGPGHDGATAGKRTVSFPLSGINPFKPAQLAEALIGDGKHPYVEAIDGDGTDIITQLRAGPALESGVHLDYIPAELTVGEVIETHGEDLLEWAKVVRALKGKPGVVVYHPGGSLTDHYSVHCRENGVPIMLTHAPAIGEVLEPLPMPPLDPVEVIRGLAVGSAANMAADNLAGPYVALSLLALHNSSALRGPASFWIGVGAAVVAKLGSCAMDGEARHAEGHQVWKNFMNKPDIYQAYAPKSLHFHRARLSRVTQLLHFGFGEKGEKAGTGGTTSGCGMGGRKWALCGASLAPLFTSMKRLVDSPTQESASQLLLDLNVAVNQAHNGGWWLNKFIAAQAYDEVPKGNIGFAIMAGRAIAHAAKVALKVDVEKFTRNVSYWPKETLISPLKWRKAELEILPASIQISLKASTLPQRRKITIPATATLMKVLIEAVGTVKANPGEIVLETATGNISLWKEPPLVATSRDPHDRTQ